MDHRTPPTRPCEPPTSALHHAYRWTIPADHPTRQRYDRAVLRLRQHLTAADQVGSELLSELVGDLDAAVDAMVEAVGNSVAQFYAPAPPACRCDFFAKCDSEGDPAVHDELLADLGGHNGVEGVARFFEHLVLTEECDERSPRLAWPDVDLFVAQHNWPDPVSTQTLAALIVHGFRGRHELRRLERQLAGR